MERVKNPAMLSQIAPMPTTTRGQGTNLDANKAGTHIAYTSKSNVVIRSLSNPDECLIYQGHNADVTVARFSPNGYWVASGDVAGNVRVWAYDTDEHMCKLALVAFAGEIKDLCWDPESKRIVAVGDGRQIQAKCFMWDTGNSVGEVVGHTKRITSCTYKPQRPYRIFTAGEDFAVCFHAGPPFKFGAATKKHTNFVNCVRYAPNGETAISVGSDKLGLFFDGKSGELAAELPNMHGGTVYCVAWKADSSQFVTCSADKSVKVWDAGTRECVATYSLGAAVTDMQVGVVWAGDYLVSLSLSGALNYLDAAAPGAPPTQTLVGHVGNLTALCVGPGGAVATADFGGAICVRQPGAQAAHFAGKGHGKRVSGLAVSPAGVLYSVGWDDKLRASSIATMAALEGAAAEVVLPGQPAGVAVGAAEPTVCVVATTKGVACVIDGAIASATPETAWTATCVAISADEALVAVGGTDSKIHLYALAAGGVLSEAGEIAGHRGALTSVAFSPDGSLLAAGDKNREICVWTVASREALVQGSWVFHATTVTSVAWSPSGKYVASGSLDEHIYLWEVPAEKGASTKRTQFANAHRSGTTAVAFLDEGTLVSAGGDGASCTWKLPTE